MLKKILSLTLILNVPYTLHSAPTFKQDVAVSCVAIAAGIICTWIAYKDFKEGWGANKEADRQLNILKEMGAPVRMVFKGKHEFNPLAFGNDYVVRGRYAMDIPLNFSQQQKKEADAHWDLFLTSNKLGEKMLGWPATGSLLLLTAGIWSLLELISSNKAR